MPSLRRGGHAAPDQGLPGSARFPAAHIRQGGARSPALPLSWRKGRAQLPPAGHSWTSNLRAGAVPGSAPPCPFARILSRVGQKKQPTVGYRPCCLKLKS